MATPLKPTAFQGATAVFVGAACWGLFWLPMRYFHEQGLASLWGIAAINLAAFAIALPATVYVRDFRREHLRWIAIIGLGMGFSNVFYFAGLILSDVIRVTFLFYLLPIWATIFSRLFFLVPLGRARMLAIAIAFVGIWLLLGGGSWPVPQNIGDVFGILAGMAWAFGLTAIRGKNELGAFATTAACHFFALIAAILMGLLFSVALPSVQAPLPSLGSVSHLALPVAAFGMLVLWTTTLGQVWGAQLIAATLAALLTMSEIMVATGSATLLGDEKLSLISWAGGIFILIAIVVDLYGGEHA